MKKLIPYFQILMASVCLLVGCATLVNLFFIVQRTETISVVNTIIGQGVLIIASFALTTILFRKGLNAIRTPSDPSSASDSADDNT